jgi:hypothetical protein
MPTPKENPVPDLPQVTTHLTPPGSVLTVRMPTDLDTEEVVPLAEELHRQTGLPVVVLSGDAALTVTTPEEARAALETALTETAEPDDALMEVSAAELLVQLRREGWELIRLRQP